MLCQPTVITDVRAFPMACVKFKPNFGLKSYFFYFVQSLFKTSSIQFSISNSILFKYYFFINFLLLFSTHLKPNKHKRKTHINFSKKKPNKFTNFHNNITENHQNQNNTSTSNGSMRKWVPLSSTSR